MSAVPDINVFASRFSAGCCHFRSREGATAIFFLISSAADSGCGSCGFSPDAGCSPEFSREDKCLCVFAV
jgi:hypothetical protein